MPLNKETKPLHSGDTPGANKFASTHTLNLELSTHHHPSQAWAVESISCISVEW